MKLSHLLWIAAAALFIGGAVAWLTGCAALGSGADWTLGQADYNRDGVVSTDEARKASDTVAAYAPVPEWLKGLLAAGGTAGLLALQEWRRRRTASALKTVVSAVEEAGDKAGAVKEIMAAKTAPNDATRKLIKKAKS